MRLKYSARLSLVSINLVFGSLQNVLGTINDGWLKYDLIPDIISISFEYQFRDKLRRKTTLLQHRIILIKLEIRKSISRSIVNGSHRIGLRNYYSKEVKLEDDKLWKLISCEKPEVILMEIWPKFKKKFHGVYNKSIGLFLVYIKTRSSSLILIIIYHKNLTPLVLGCSHKI